MKTYLPFLAAALLAVLVPDHARAARMQDPQQVMSLDLSTCPRPAYPAAALAQRAGGKTTVELQIDAQGLVAGARMLVSSGRDDLDQAALAGIRRCTFPGLVAGGQTPTGWLKTQYVWIPGAVQKPEADDQAQVADTRERAAAGDPVAQNRLGAWYQNGTHVKADAAQAAHWYRLAADSGNAIAQNNLGVLYYRGNGVPLDLAQAVAWYAKAAEQGHGWAQANLAWAYEHGSGIERDIDQAQAWLTRSAEGGLAPAQVRLGLMLMLRAASDEQRTAAAAWLARAAAQDFPAGAYYLGRSFELGLGNAQDDARAAALYRKAFERSEGRAETALGMLMEAGRAGAADPDGAAKLYQKAMRWRYPAAYYRYGRLLEQNGDTELAAVAYRHGAELGDCDATLKYVQARALQAAQPGTDAYWARRAQACAARVELPAQL